MTEGPDYKGSSRVTWLFYKTVVENPGMKPSYGFASHVLIVIVNLF